MKKIAVISFLVLIVSVAVFFIIGGGKGISGFIIRNNSFDVSTIVFKGADGKEIYGLLYLPSNKNIDVLVVLPGGGGTKESRSFYGDILVEMSYGVLILDQRGIGETGGDVGSFFDGLYDYLKGIEGDQFLMARDVISAVDYLEAMEGVDEIAVLGESMGGRNGIIAGGLDKRIKGVIAISSAGFSGSIGNEFGDKYLDIINPNSYIGIIAPRRVLMLHANKDSVIPIKDARYTFSLANEPKKLIEFDEAECSHGYCGPMRDYIEEELREVFN